LLYKFLKILVGIGIRVFYKEVKVIDQSRLKMKGPKIIIANHPNTLMDAWMIGHVSPDPVYYMAKATLFNSPLKLWLLKRLNMIPINRKGEKSLDKITNKSSFEACFQLLEEGKTLLIFPEGSSFLERQLRMLKSGAARIALEAERRQEGKLNLNIIPLGLNYLRADKFRSSVLIQVGEPMKVNDRVEDFVLNGSLTAREITARWRTSLESVLVSTLSKEREVLEERISTLLKSKYRDPKTQGVLGCFEFLKDIRNKLDLLHLDDHKKLIEIEKLVAQIEWRLNKLEIRSEFLDRPFRSVMFFRQIALSILFLVISLPFFLFGVVHNFIPFVLTGKMTHWVTKEVEYVAPLAVLVGMVLYPLTYFICIEIVSHLVDLTLVSTISYVIFMPLSGLFSFWFHRYMKHISYKWRYVFLMFSNKAAILELQKMRVVLREIVFDKTS
jgi:1-acyl-sn-glycerol-3-phosphate acyltransferase